MSNPFIPFPSFRPYTNITPFTVRDGATYLIVLEELRAYIRDTLVPEIDTEVGRLTESWHKSIQVLLAGFLENQATLQDPVMAQITNDDASQFREALAGVLAEVLSPYAPKTYAYDKETSDARYYQKSATYSKTEADQKFKTVTASDTAITQTNERVTATNERVTGLETLVGTGRLSDSELEKRFVKKIKNPVVIWLGSSNAESGRNTWPKEFADRNGLINKNFAVGGGGFVSNGDANFYTQATKAVADASIDKASVKYVMIADCSNDIRAEGAVAQPAGTLFSYLEANYPNARIVVIPATLPHTPANVTSTVRRSVGRIYNQLRNIATDFNRVDIIKNSALWLWDGGGWNAGETIDVHMSGAGQKRVRWFLEQYVNLSIDHTNDLGDGTGAVAGPHTGTIHSTRFNGLVHTYGTIKMTADQNTSMKLMQVYAGFWPIDNIPLTLIRKSDGLTKAMSFENNGEINLQIPVPAGDYYFSTTYQTV